MTILAAGLCVATKATVCDVHQSLAGHLRMALSQKTEMYRRVSTAPSYIRIKVNDAESGRVWTMILENTDFAGFLARERGIKESDLVKFYNQEYVEYMLQNAENPMNVDVGKFEEFLAHTRFGSKAAAKKHLQSNSYQESMTLQELGVQNGDELVEKYFVFDKQTHIGSLKPGFAEANEPTFIGLLIDLGYVVSRGDIAPILRIHVAREAPCHD